LLLTDFNFGLDDYNLYLKKTYTLYIVPKKKDESITPLFMRGFQLFIHKIKWL
jgi:hypothetical protein